MKILVVGGAGYVGGVIVDLLIARKNYDVTMFMTIFYMKIAIEKIASL